MKPMKLIALALAAGAPSLALAQPAAVVDQGRVDRKPQVGRDLKKAQPPAKLPPRGEVRVADSGPGAPLARVLVSGSSLPQASLDAAVAPFAGRPLTRETVTAITEAVGAVYARSDIALYTIVAPDQDLSTGELRLTAIEGRITQVALSGDTAGDMTLVTTYGERLAGEAPLRKRTLERYLSLARDIPGLKVQADMLAGQAAGDVVLAMDLKQQRTDLALSLTNRGSEILGRTQAQADFSVYGLARQGDMTRLTVALPTEIERFQYYAVTHSTPIGSDGLRAQVSAGYLRTRPESIPVKGKAVFGGLQLSYPAIRSYDEDLYLTAAFDGLNSTNAVFGQGTATERTRVLRGAAAWSKDRYVYAVSAAVVGSFGIDGLGARTTPGLADAAFKKLNLEAGADVMLSPRWTVRLKAAGQSTGDLLPASEQFGLGGEPYGRAYQQAVVIGDTGWAVSAELALKALTAGRFKDTEIYGFVDGGQVTQKARFTVPKRSFDLGSSGVGVRVAMGEKIAFGIEGAYGHEPPFASAKKAWRLGVSFRMLR